MRAAVSIVFLVGSTAQYAAAAPMAPPTGWVEVAGNACAKGFNGGGGSPCGCSSGGCHSVKGFDFLGSTLAAKECEAKCTSSANCTIWIHSESSHHCWSRTDGYWGPDASHGVTSGCNKQRIKNCGSKLPPAPAPVPPTPRGPFVPKWTAEPNMNGAYPLSPTPKGRDVDTKFPKSYADFPKGQDIGGIEYFDMYSPLFSQLYSQVWWTGLAPTPFPKDVIERYAGRGMVIAGFEMDQVRRAKGCECQEGGACNVDRPECAKSDISVPLTLAYNHHFESHIAGGKARFENVQFTGEDDPRLMKLLEDRAASGMGGHGIPSHEQHWMVLDDEEPVETEDGSIPSSTALGAGNGGEYRKSFHGYAPGYGQVIGSPHTFQLTPMQIDTWNRDKMDLVTGRPFVPGPLPRNSMAPPGASYSGLLECPLTTRVTKVFDSDATLEMSGSCKINTTFASECFANAKAAIGKAAAGARTLSGSDPTKPVGCSVSMANGTDIEIYFNTASEGAACGGRDGGVVGGTIDSVTSVHVAIDSAKDLATITASGPSADWFGVGFGAQAMKQKPWAIIMEGDGKVTERQLADQSPGQLLPSTLAVVSNTVADGKRTVVMTRSLQGKYFTFSPKVATIPMINAVGSGPKLAYHKMKDPVTLSLLPIGGGGTCVCAGKAAPFGSQKGKLMYTPTNQTGERGKLGSVSFGNNCAPAPRTVLLEQKNPTCDIRSYVGGQTACHHMWSLLDADQEIPWPDQPLEYHLKVRFWVQPYNRSYHTPVSHHATWGIASPVEYDVPKCGPGVPGCSAVPGSSNPNGAEGKEWIHTIEGVYKGGGNLSVAHFHCHAPTCIYMRMMRNDTGEIICEERPVYGGTGKLDLSKFDEPGYILQPPCVWGKEEHGLQLPVDVDGVMLKTVKASNATAGHHGEMAWQQMFMVDEYM
jgi:hypothetical protein